MSNLKLSLIIYNCAPALFVLTWLRRDFLSSTIHHIQRTPSNLNTEIEYRQYSNVPVWIINMNSFSSSTRRFDEILIKRHFEMDLIYILNRLKDSHLEFNYSNKILYH